MHCMILAAGEIADSRAGPGKVGCRARGSRTFTDHAENARASLLYGPEIVVTGGTIPHADSSPSRRRISVPHLGHRMSPVEVGCVVAPRVEAGPVEAGCVEAPVVGVAWTDAGA